MSLNDKNFTPRTEVLEALERETSKGHPLTCLAYDGDWGSLGGGVGLRLSCRMIAFGAKESASRCGKPRVVHSQHDEKIKSSWCVRTI